MKIKSALPWTAIHEFLTVCGNTRTPSTFATQIMTTIHTLCSYDEGLVYFLNSKGLISNSYLFGIEEHWNNLYLDYYSRKKIPCIIANISSSTPTSYRENTKAPTVELINWKIMPKTDFLAGYIIPRNIHYTLGFALFDLNHIPRLVFALDRRRDIPFTETEYETMLVATTHLNNLYKNFFVDAPDMSCNGKINCSGKGLTPREVEITTLLCRGYSPRIISTKLCISQATTYKHISHIYQKMEVSNRQELLVKFLT